MRVFFAGLCASGFRQQVSGLRLQACQTGRSRRHFGGRFGLCGPVVPNGARVMAPATAREVQRPAGVVRHYFSVRAWQAGRERLRAPYEFHTSFASRPVGTVSRAKNSGRVTVRIRPVAPRGNPAGFAGHVLSETAGAPSLGMGLIPQGASTDGDDRDCSGPQGPGGTVRTFIPGRNVPLARRDPGTGTSEASRPALPDAAPCNRRDTCPRQPERAPWIKRQNVSSSAR